MSIQQQATIPGTAAQVYAILADAEALSALSGMSGQAGRSAGEEFSAFDGHVTGRQIDLVTDQRLVQAWRFPVWEPGRYSIVRFTLETEDGGTAWSSTRTASRKRPTPSVVTRPGTIIWMPTGRPST
jgi:activator of HSP90 ATPase